MHSFILIAAAATETPFILFGCALFAVALFVYVFYQPGEVEVTEAKTRYGTCRNARMLPTKIFAISTSSTRPAS